jgi:hypothetical protein
MKAFFFLLLMGFSFSLSGQDNEDLEWKEPSPASQEYHAYRTVIAWPSWGISRITSLIEKIEFDDKNELEALDEKIYNGLTLREKFTYNMIHPESFRKISDAMPPIQDEHKKIFGRLPEIFEGYTWSSRQEKFLHDNRDTVMTLIKLSSFKSGRVEANYKQAIAEINGTEMIPFLINIYNLTKKDHDILTLLMLLMESNNYRPFKVSLSHRKLYSDQSDAQSYLDFNKANEALIIQRALDFYNGLKN